MRFAIIGGDRRQIETALFLNSKNHSVVTYGLPKIKGINETANDFNILADCDAMILPLPDMYGKNLIFKTGGVDGCDCEEILSLIEQGKIDTTSLITHKYKLKDIEKAYEIFENKQDNVMKVAISN